MQRSFHLFIQRHVNDWITASVLTHPEYAAYGPKLGPLRDEIEDVLSDELSSGSLTISGESWFDKLQQRVLQLDLRAVQHDRLITVPMRFTLLQRPLEAEDHFEIWLPRLGKIFQIFGEENIIPWAEEVVRGFFHLDGVERLLSYQYERGARIERLDVVYHGSKRLKKARISKNFSPESDIFSPYQSPLSQIGVELVEEARRGRLAKVHFRAALVEELLSVLTGGQGRSVLLVGPSGVGKTAVVHNIAQRIAQDQVPVRLQGVPVWHITGGRIIAGMKYLGQWQERAREVVEEVRSERGILYVDNVLELMMAGSARTGLNVARFLLPTIRSGELTVIAEATPDALLLAEQTDGAFLHALRRVPVSGFDTEQAYAILELYSRQLSKAHKVDFSPDSLSRALDVLARFGDAESLPGSGLALIEQMALTPPPAPRGKRPRLEAQAAVEAFSRSSGFPQALIDPDQLLDVEGVRGFFAERIIGQPHATALMTNLVMLVKASLNDPSKPLGSFLFMGPTGVGKTESALTLAQYLFGDRDRLVRFDMSEFAYPGAAARLVGDGRGEGDLTRRIREQPFCVVLFDEIEKANSEVFDILLQVLGEGRLTDGTGRTVRFAHTIVIMTSNLGAARTPPIGVSHGAPDATSLSAHYLDAAARFFRPEFINRIDFTVPFGDLDEPSVRHIARMMLDAAISREGFGRRGIDVRYDEVLLDLLMSLGFDPEYGARPMKRAVEQHVLIPMSRRLVRRARQDEERFDLYVHKGRVAVVSSRGVADAPAPEATGPVLSHDALWRRHLHGVRLRLQDWEESRLFHTLIDEGDRALPDAMSAAREALGALEESAGGGPEGLVDDVREALAIQARAVDAQVAALEWALCLRGFGGADHHNLMIEPGALHPETLRSARALAEQLSVWCQRRGLEVELIEEPDRWRLVARGPGAEAMLQVEQGLHRFKRDETDFDVIVYEGAAPPEAPGVVREITGEPPTLWDPVTEVERPAGFDTLADHLDRFVLARMCVRASKGTEG